MEQEQNQNPNPTPEAAPAASTAAPAAEPVSADKQKEKLFGILSYIGILIVVSYLVEKDNPFVKFHIKQGAVIFVVEIAVMVALSLMPILAPFGMIVNLACIVFSIIGIVNVVKGQEKELPFIGRYAKHVPI